MAERFQWDTSRTLIMGVLNVTPDSFSDGGKFNDVLGAVEHARAMAKAGADIIDIGGESTRPGAEPVSAVDEVGRVLPVIEKLFAEWHGRLARASDDPARDEPTGRMPVPLLSIDTTKAGVAAQALAAGARIVNDISALRFDSEMVNVVREHGAGLVLMHMQGTPQTMQQAPRYTDVVREVGAFLAERVELAVAHGVEKSQIAVDPGIGFGKTVEHNLELLARLKEFDGLGCPVVVGVSRKSLIGKVLGREPHERLWGSLGVAAWAASQGADIVRVHDVAETVDMVRMIDAIKEWQNG